MIFLVSAHLEVASQGNSRLGDELSVEVEPCK